MATTHQTLRHQTSNDSMTITLDQRGHLEEPPCTWAPPSQESSERARCLPFCGTVVTTTTISLTHSNPRQQHSPEQEQFPPMYPLPHRSTHNYEEECSKGKEERRDSSSSTVSYPSSQPEGQEKFYLDRRRSFNMEDFKRTSHMRLMSESK